MNSLKQWRWSSSESFSFRRSIDHSETHTTDTHTDTVGAHTQTHNHRCPRTLSPCVRTEQGTGFGPGCSRCSHALMWLPAGVRTIDTEQIWSQNTGCRCVSPPATTVTSLTTYLKRNTHKCIIYGNTAWRESKLPKNFTLEQQRFDSSESLSEELKQPKKKKRPAAVNTL